MRILSHQIFRYDVIPVVLAALMKHCENGVCVRCCCVDSKISYSCMSFCNKNTAHTMINASPLEYAICIVDVFKLQPCCREDTQSAIVCVYDFIYGK